ncbi:hypothetical protein ABLA76_17100 [Xenorhabdus sp. SGI240]
MKKVILRLLDRFLNSLQLLQLYQSNFKMHVIFPREAGSHALRES